MLARPIRKGTFPSDLIMDSGVPLADGHIPIKTAGQDDWTDGGAPAAPYVPPSGSTTTPFANTSVPGGNTVGASSTAENAFASSYTIPAGTLTVGSVIRVKLAGVYATGISASTMTLRVKFAGVTLAATAAVTLPTSGSGNGWTAWVDCIVLTVAASGTIEAQGLATFATNATNAAATSVPMPNSAAITAVNTSAAGAVTATAQFGTSGAANAITLRLMTVELAIA